MDTAERLAQLLSSSSVVPNYSKKWSAYGRMLQPQAMGDQISAAGPKTTVLGVGQPNVKLSVISGIKLQLSDGGEVDVDKDLLHCFTQYNFNNGLPELRRWLLNFQEMEHNPPQMQADPTKFDLCITTGSTGAMQSCIQSIMEKEDTILMEDTSYINFIINLKTQGLGIQGVASDDKGMLPSALEDTLRNWELNHSGRRMPKLLYTVTSASNPFGYNWCLERMLEIYEICRKYDILIMDDGAYHFVQFGQQRPRSFQSLDIDGRVIRFDSFSKIVGAGYRVGWLSGPSDVIEKVTLHHELTCIHASVPAQVALYTVLKKWGTPGLEAQVQTVSDFYRVQAECVLNACDKYLTGLAKWTTPQGGMFIWISFNDRFPGNSDAVSKELKVEHDIQVISGKLFHAKSDVEDKSIRLCFSTASQEAITNAIKCLAGVLRRGAPEAMQNGFVV